jgi:hypothetical protein
LYLVEVPEKAIVPFMVNAFDYVTFIHMLNWDLPRKFWEKKREIINFHNYWFLICPVVNDRLYITFLPIKFYSYPVIVYSMSNFSEFISRKNRSFSNYFRKIEIAWSN